MAPPELEENENSEHYNRYVEKKTILETNEHMFTKVFQALKKCQNKDTLIEFLKVIQFYSNHPKQLHFSVIINTDTTQWLLETLVENLHLQRLSCIISLVLLNIVNKHMDKMKIEYNEQAII